jgi:hypothetical protein
MNGNFPVLRFFGHRRRAGRVGGAAELQAPPANWMTGWIRSHATHPNEFSGLTRGRLQCSPRMAELKREATSGPHHVRLVETALRLLFRSQRKRRAIPVLPTFGRGGTLVDIADRDALYHAMEGR